MGVGFNPGETLISIEGLVSGGRGVGREDGRVWFVRGALPGDRVWARAERVRSRFVEAVGVRFELHSPLRREAPCAHQDRCGGCPWMPLPEDRQREWKRRLVVDALTRIAGLEDPAVEPVRHPSAPLGYRNRVEFTAAAGLDGKPAIGLWGRVEQTRALVDLPGCPLQTERANALLDRIRRLVAQRPDIGRRLVEQGPFRLLIRTTSTGFLSLGFWGTEHPFPSAAELAAALVRAPDAPASIVELRARPGRRGGVRARTLHGSATIRERLGEFEFELPPASFMQVNPAGGEALIDIVRELAGDVRDRRILDLFGGVGAFGLHLARRGARWVVVCDADREAIDAGRRAGRYAGLVNVRFVHQTVRAYLQSQQGKATDLLLANPPRSGFGRGVAAGILALEPRRMIIVSCDPPTLARDLGPLLSAGYRPGPVVPVDLFPQSHHIETVVLLEKPN
jgi:23S rRNA (uracil1939-C5)-methyltransferase